MIVEYQDYLRSEEWQARATAAKRRYGYRCALCNSDRPLEAHHRTYARVGHESPLDLIPLCEDCHRRHHGNLPRAPMFVAGQLPLFFRAHCPQDEELN